MINNKRDFDWNVIFILCQLIYLTIAIGFISKESYAQAAGFLFFSGGVIGLGKTKNSAVKFLNRIILSLAVILAMYWVYKELTAS